MGTRGHVTSLHFLLDLLSCIGHSRVLTLNILIESLELCDVLIELQQVFLEDVEPELQTVMRHEKALGHEAVRLFERQTSSVALLLGFCMRNQHRFIQTYNNQTEL